MLALIFLLCFFQTHRGVNPSAVTSPHCEKNTFDRLDEMADSAAQQAAEQDEKRRAAALEERDFVSRFNHLLDTIRDFSTNYNAHHTVDLKRIKALKKAWRDLEKSNAFFRVDEHSNTDSNREKSAFPH